MEQGFNKALGQIVSHGFANSTRSFARALTRSRSKASNPEAYYASQLSRLTAAFAYCSDIALTMGGKIKVSVGAWGRAEERGRGGSGVEGVGGVVQVMHVGSQMSPNITRDG